MGNCYGVSVDAEEESSHYHEWTASAIKEKAIIHHIHEDTPESMREIDLSDDSVILLRCLPTFIGWDVDVLFCKTDADEPRVLKCRNKTIASISKQICELKGSCDGKFVVCYTNLSGQKVYTRFCVPECDVVLLWTIRSLNIPSKGTMQTCLPIVMKVIHSNKSVEICLCNGEYPQWIRDRKVLVLFPETEDKKSIALSVMTSRGTPITSVTSKPTDEKAGESTSDPIPEQKIDLKDLAVARDVPAELSE